MTSVEDFLTQNEEQEIVEAIKKAETVTSGEIRIHIEKKLTKDSHERALEVFHYLEMEKTKLHNGVLLYVAVESKAFAIYGDKGIHSKVPETFWNETKNTVISFFKKELYKKGLVEGVLEIGLKLKAFFPLLEDDKNELSNEISKGE